jgi:hypothetical protein
MGVSGRRAVLIIICSLILAPLIGYSVTLYTEISEPRMEDNKWGYYSEFCHFYKKIKTNDTIYRINRCNV